MFSVNKYWRLVGTKGKPKKASPSILFNRTVSIQARDFACGGLDRLYQMWPPVGTYEARVGTSSDFPYKGRGNLVIFSQWESGSSHLALVMGRVVMVSSGVVRSGIGLAGLALIGQPGSKKLGLES
ncbi:hypothetical protein AMTR_s00024p00249500 [Amborella trichopoda]|uniref:Uncharacterized protein n=1 Tax=Amborella trichopoda TaxID=13333 RepID=W1PMT6_AMBTC|nr:hypothetical protein AMTR_s00024p00249500 [Amborella trichopoda]